jgi:Icc-related predicted phosphoesterase
MRLVATSDTHYVVDVKKWIPDGDVFIHAGDLMRTGYPSDFEDQLDWLNELPHAIKLYVPGNHDFHLQVYPGPALQQLRKVGVTVLGLPGNENYETYTLPNGKRVLGLPYVTGLPRWAFDVTDEQLQAVLNNHYDEIDIVVSHMPPRYTCDKVGEYWVGNAAYAEFAEGRYHHPIKHWIFGHIHEGYGTIEKLGTMYYNVAMCDRSYTHANYPMVIDL